MEVLLTTGCAAVACGAGVASVAGADEGSARSNCQTANPPALSSSMTDAASAAHFHPGVTVARPGLFGVPGAL